MTPVDYVLAGIAVLCGVNAAGILLLFACRAYYDRKARRRPRPACHPHANGMQHSARSIHAAARPPRRGPA